MKDVFTLISSYDALPLSIVCIRPQGIPRAVVQFAHGMCGCKERFLPVMEFLAENGYACVANDHRGHGGSGLLGCELNGRLLNGGLLSYGGEKRSGSRARGWQGWGHWCQGQHHRMGGAPPGLHSP